MVKKAIDQQVEESQNQVKSVYDDKVATINGTDYEFSTFTHMERKKVFAFMSSIVNPNDGSFRTDFWDEPRFNEVEQLINTKITVDGIQISKKQGFWDNEEYAEDYIGFMMLAMQVVSYPFMKGGLGK